MCVCVCNSQPTILKLSTTDAEHIMTEGQKLEKTNRDVERVCGASTGICIEGTMHVAWNGLHA